MLISKKTGLKFEVKKDLTWPEAYDLALAGEIDAMPAIGKTEEREKSFIFSEPYYYFKRVIATKDVDVHISSLEDLVGEAVAVQRNSSHHSYLLTYEKINLSLYDTVEAALTAVATDQEVAFIGNLASTNYLIRTNGLTNLRFVAFEAEKEQALHFAARKDLPELVSIFNKAISQITEEEKKTINNKWIELNTHLDYGPILRTVAVIGGIMALILLVSVFWNLKLRKELYRRTLVQNQLEIANNESDEANRRLKAANEELAKISMVDGLTGISNRRYFDSFMGKVWNINLRERFPLALIMIDIDNFKIYNDTYGHLAGDKCLISIAGLIDDTVQRGSNFVARYGGEKFAVILSNTSETGAAVLAEKIRVTIENLTVVLEDMDTQITVSLGVAAVVTSKNLSPDDLINSADCALYGAKNRGRNRVVKASELWQGPIAATCTRTPDKKG